MQEFGPLAKVPAPCTPAHDRLDHAETPRVTSPRVDVPRGGEAVTPVTSDGHAGPRRPAQTGSRGERGEPGELLDVTG